MKKNYHDCISVTMSLYLLTETISVNYIDLKEITDVGDSKEFNLILFSKKRT